MNIEKKIKIIKLRLKKHWRCLVLAMLAICFFIGVSSYNHIIQQDEFIKWGSPDENANYIFTKLYGQETKLAIYEKYNLYVDGIMRPRSFKSDSGVIKPTSFLGIILIYGKIANFATYKIIPYLTPLFAAIGILYYYLLIKKIFGRRNALISAFLLASFPVYIYYSARSMFHNVPFMVLLITGLYYSMLMARKKNKKAKLPVKNSASNLRNWLCAGLAGGFIGLAAITRTSELIWIAPMLFILWIFNIKKIGFIRLILFLSFFTFAFTPVFYWNQILYNSPIQGGYAEMNQSIAEIASAGSNIIKSDFSNYLARSNELFSKLQKNIFYFGIHPRHSLEMFYQYFIKMFYWIFWPMVFGGILFLQKARKWKRRHWAYIASYFTISTILLFYYGSWNFHDNPDPSRFTIGNSYTRYWLPIYLSAFPFVSLFIIKFSRALLYKYNANLRITNNANKAEYLKRLIKRPKKLFLVNCVRIIIIIIIFFISIQFVLFGSEEGLIFSAQNHKQAKNEYNKILNLTEHNSVIITRYHDKLLFPERKVIVGLFNDKNMVAKYADLANHLPVYYYNFLLPPDAIEYLNKKRLAEADLQIKKIERINEFGLYRLSLTAHCLSKR